MLVSPRAFKILKLRTVWLELWHPIEDADLIYKKVGPIFTIVRIVPMQFLSNYGTFCNPTCTGTTPSMEEIMGPTSAFKNSSFFFKFYESSSCRRLPVREFLHRIFVRINLMCPLCRLAPESVDHFFVKYLMVRLLWQHISLFACIPPLDSSLAQWFSFLNGDGCVGSFTPLRFHLFQN